MADMIKVDLTTLERVFHDGLDAGFHTLDSCIPEIGISAEILAAIRAGKLGRFDSVVGPSEFSATVLAVK